MPRDDASSSHSSSSSTSYSVSSSYAELEEAFLPLFILCLARRVMHDYLPSSSSSSSSSSDTSSEDELYTAIRALKESYERRYQDSDTVSASSDEKDSDENNDESAIASPSPSTTPHPPAPPSPTQHLLSKMSKQPAQKRLWAPSRAAVLRDLENCRPLALGNNSSSKDLVCRKDNRDESAVQDPIECKHVGRKRKNGLEDQRVSSTEAAGAVVGSSSLSSGVSRGRKRRRV